MLQLHIELGTILLVFVGGLGVRVYTQGRDWSRGLLVEVRDYRALVSSVLFLPIYLITN